MQKRARDLGNSVFVNEDLITYEDQWAFLSGLRKISRQEAETIVSLAERKGRIVGMHLRMSEEDDITPWNRPFTHNKTVPASIDLPESLEIVVGNEIYIRLLSKLNF